MYCKTFWSKVKFICSVRILQLFWTFLYCFSFTAFTNVEMKFWGTYPSPPFIMPPVRRLPIGSCQMTNAICVVCLKVVPQTFQWWDTCWDICRLLGDALLHPTFPLTMLCQLHTSLLIVASSRQSTLTAPILESDGPMVMWHCNLLQSCDVATFCISITFSPFFIFFIILLFQLRFLVYRHASHLSRALSFSFRIPC